MTETADAIIVGAGVHGASLALHLARRGLTPTVLEQHAVAAGATGRSSGVVRMHYDIEAESRLAWASFPCFRDWREVVGAGDCGFVRTGFLQLVRPGFSDRLRANVAMHQRIGIPSLVVSADDVRRLAPMIEIEDGAVAAFEPESGYADPTATATGFLEAARDLGAHLVQGRRVTGVTVAGGRVTGVETDRASYSAPIVVDCAGAWAAGIGRMVGLELPVDVWRHDTAYVRRPPAMGTTHPTVIDDANALYFRPEGRELTLVGLEDGSEVGGSPDRETASTSPGFAEQVAERVVRRLPAMSAATLHGAHSGQDGITPDQRAILDRAGPDGFYVVCGFSGTGFKIAPAVGAGMSELILDGRAMTVDITPFSLARFAEGRPLVGEHAYERIWR